MFSRCGSLHPNLYSLMLIDDLIVLGRAVPEPLRDGRVTVCLAGWSEKLGFVRLYPTRHDMQFRRWDIIKVPVEKNNRDTREESWKIAGSRDEWDTLTAKVEKVGRLDSNEGQRNLIGNLCDPSVTYINDQRRSLGIIHPYVIQTYFRDNPKYGQLYQQGLPGFTQLGSVQVKRDFPDEPRVKYTCPDVMNQTNDMTSKSWNGVFTSGLGKTRTTKSKSGKTRSSTAKIRTFIS